jgi:hypothetical protein
MLGEGGVLGKIVLLPNSAQLDGGRINPIDPTAQLF